MRWLTKREPRHVHLPSLGWRELDRWFEDSFGPGLLGAVETYPTAVRIDDQLARRSKEIFGATGIGTHPTATSNSVNGVFHFPVAKNSDKTYGPGCAVTSSGLTPTDVSAGAAVAGNANFALALWSGPPNQNYIMTLGVARLNVPLGNAGCKLLTSPVLLLGGTLSAVGMATIRAPLPANLPANSFVHRQWGCDDGAGGLVLSNARTTTIK